MAPSDIDSDAWRGGMHRAPTWSITMRGLGLVPCADTPGLHALVREFGLPRAELLHMGWTDALLSSSAPPQLPLSRVADLVGRLVLDGHYNLDGGCWPMGRDHARFLGAELIYERFSPC